MCSAHLDGSGRKASGCCAQTRQRHIAQSENDSPFEDAAQIASLHAAAPRRPRSAVTAALARNASKVIEGFAPEVATSLEAEREDPAMVTYAFLGFAALGCFDRILTLAPEAALEYRDRGMLLERLDCVMAAIDDYARFLEMTPEDPSAGPIRKRRDALAQHKPTLN